MNRRCMDDGKGTYMEGRPGSHEDSQDDMVIQARSFYFIASRAAAGILMTVGNELLVVLRLSYWWLCRFHHLVEGRLLDLQRQFPKL